MQRIIVSLLIGNALSLIGCIGLAVWSNKLSAEIESAHSRISSVTSEIGVKEPSLLVGGSSIWDAVKSTRDLIASDAKRDNAISDESLNRRVLRLYAEMSLLKGDLGMDLPPPYMSVRVNCFKETYSGKIICQEPRK